MRRLPAAAAALALLTAGAPFAGGEPAEEPVTEPKPSQIARFFAGCPNKPPIRVHRDNSAFDLHAIAYTSSAIMELEVVRLLDWVLDLPFPGELRPIERSLNGIRLGYNRIGGNPPMRRVAELVDAFQLRELTLGDATVTYNVATGSSSNPGGGTLIRVNKLIDWTQHIVGDVNWMVGRPFGRHGGALRWRQPGQAVDVTQKGLVKLVHGVQILLVRTLDHTLVGLELGTEAVLNIGRSAVHAQNTVFLRMPPEVYRAHELWIIANRTRIYAGTPEELRAVTHERLFHSSSKLGLRDQWNIERLPAEPAIVVMVTDRLTFSKAPEGLWPYVVPPAWVLEDPAE